MLAEALIRQGQEIIPVDATLRGIPRVFNAIQTFRPNLQEWRERFWKNISAFETRSRLLADQVLFHHPDLILQIGVTFDATRYQQEIPLHIYTDYTAALSARSAHIGRSPFTPSERELWIQMEHEAYHRAAHIFARSRFVKFSLMRDYGVSDKMITVCGGGVNIDPLPDIPKRSISATPKILFIGKEFKRKGGDLLLKAFSMALQKFPRAVLIVVTNEKIDENLPRKNVRIKTATWNRTAIHELYQNADIFVLPSRLETWGDVLLEAMSFGLPCIGVTSDAMGEIIQHGECGLLVPAEDAAELANAMSTLLDNPEMRRSMGMAGRQQVEASFTWEKVATQICTVFSVS